MGTDVDCAGKAKNVLAARFSISWIVCHFANVRFGEPAIGADIQLCREEPKGAAGYVAS